jgi:hypothetical protein
MMWSCTEMPSGVAMSTIAFVIWMSALDGEGSPLGWLCTRMIAASLAALAYVSWHITSVSAMQRHVRSWGNRKWLADGQNGAIDPYRKSALG